jgi:hypothetical protein
MPELEELQQVCRRLLDNADLDVWLDAENGEIVLCFLVAGSYEQIMFRCGRFHSFKMVKDPEEQDCFFVGETRVSVFTEPEEIKQGLANEGWTWGESPLPSHIYQIEVLGGIEVRVVCGTFAWNLIPPTQEQRPQSYRQRFAPPPRAAE